jgi:DNA-binding helix-hairpin-helix protein with protein kinase domain
VLNLTLKNDPRAARAWFRRALDEGGPDPRPEIEAWLTRCDAAEAGKADVGVREKNRWAAPIAP